MANMSRRLVWIYNSESQSEISAFNLDSHNISESLEDITAHHVFEHSF